MVLNFILIVKFEKFWPDESPFLTLDAWRNGMGSQVLRYAHISLYFEVISQYEHHHANDFVFRSKGVF